MPSFTTIYRAIVMLAAGMMIVKGWQLYGPSSEQVKSIGVRGVELAYAAWNQWQPPPGGAGTGPRGMAPPFGGVTPKISTDPAPLIPAPALTTGSVEAVVPVGDPGSGAPAVAPLPVTSDPSVALEATDKSLALSAGDRANLPALLSRLEELGAADAELTPWGTSGQLYRFHCRAKMANVPNITQHFESVAAEPLVAVQQVVAKVEAWRIAQGDSGQMR